MTDAVVVVVVVVRFPVGVVGCVMEDDRGFVSLPATTSNVGIV
jgi:hypothetical protein